MATDGDAHTATMSVLNYPIRHIVAHIIINFGLSLLVCVLVLVRYRHQLGIRPLTVSYVLGNVCIGVVAFMTIAWAIIAALIGVSMIQFIQFPAGNPLASKQAIDSRAKVRIPKCVPST